MAKAWKTVRVFISSTFRDMQAERDHLVRFVFPKIREQLLARRIHLVDIDLRWGVTSDQDVLSVCQEIIDACRPRFLCMLGGRYGWVPPGLTRSITADEIHYGALNCLGQHGYAFFYFRNPDVTAMIIEDEPGEFKELPGSNNERKLKELKETIENAGLKPFIYPAQWDDRAKRLIGLRVFGDRVYADLKKSIDQEYGEHTAVKLGEFAEESAVMDAFIEERTLRFVLGSRETVRSELINHLNTQDSNRYLCLIGEPGTGKSAMLAHLTQHLTSNTQSATLVIPHFVGSSIGSTDVYRTLRRLCHELIIGTGITAEIPNDPRRLLASFPEILKQACEEKRVVILLDAINQFDSTLHFGSLSWLPEELPDNARVILSTLPGPALDELRRRRHPPKEVTLPALKQADGEIIVNKFLNRYRKTMTDKQRAMLLGKTDACTPLYLLAALEELRTLGTYEEITDRIKQLPPKTQALFAWIINRLKNDDGFIDASYRKTGQKLVPLFVSFVGVSRHGMSQRELVELLAPGNPKEEAGIPSDAQGNVAALVQLLRPYLMYRGELLDFSHSQFRESVETEFLDSETKRQAAHRELGNYFLNQAHSVRDGTWKGEIPRGFSELLFHLKSAGLWNEVSSCIKDIRIFEHLSPSVYDVDYNKGISMSPDPDALTPDSLSSLPTRLRSEVGYDIAEAFANHARIRILRTQTYEQPWPETRKYLRENDDEGFAAYRDTFYSFIRLAGKVAEFAIAAFDDSKEGRKDLRAFSSRNGDIRSFLHYLHHFGHGETGLSHALEDDAYPSYKAWEDLRRLAALTA